MSPKLFVMLALTGLLAWMAADDGARRQGVREARGVYRAVKGDIDGRLMARDMDKRLRDGDVRALALAGFYHSDAYITFPLGFRRALERTWGPPDSAKGFEYTKRAAEKGDFISTRRLWRVTGEPDLETLFELSEQGNPAAFWRAQQRLMEEGCPAPEQLKRLFETEGSKRLQRRMPADEAIETYRAWYTENCPAEPDTKG